MKELKVIGETRLPMIVSDDVRVSILGFIDFQVGIVPSKLLSRLDGFVFFGKLGVVVGFEQFYVIGEVIDENRRMRRHRRRVERETTHLHGVRSAGRRIGDLAQTSRSRQCAEVRGHTVVERSRRQLDRGSEMEKKKFRWLMTL